MTKQRQRHWTQEPFGIFVLSMGFLISLLVAFLSLQMLFWP